MVPSSPHWAVFTRTGSQEKRVFSSIASCQVVDDSNKKVTLIQIHIYGCEVGRRTQLEIYPFR